ANSDCFAGLDRKEVCEAEGNRADQLAFDLTVFDHFEATHHMVSVTGQLESVRCGRIDGYSLPDICGGDARCEVHREKRVLEVEPPKADVEVERGHLLFSDWGYLRTRKAP